MRFRQVFGHNRGGGEPVLAQRVLLDFCDKYPEGSEKKGVKRGGNFSITNYVQNTGSRRVKRQRRQRPKMDYEWFITTMETQRKWSAAKADAKWKELDAVPANFADHGGPEPWTIDSVSRQAWSAVNAARVMTKTLRSAMQQRPEGNRSNIWALKTGQRWRAR